MKVVAAFSVLVGTAAAFQAPKMTSVKSQLQAAPAGAEGPKSKALPYSSAPSALDGSMIGDAGFDPFFYSSTAVGPDWLPISGLDWYREAELIHGRIAQMAVLGFIWPGLFGTLKGNEWTGVDAYSYTNPLEALEKVPGVAIAQIILFMAALEFRRCNFLLEDGASHMPGDYRWGQGPGRWNPFNFNYTPEEYKEKQLQELKHCRLAMIAVAGLYFQAKNSGIGVIDQIGAALTAPDYYAKAGYFIPEGI